MGCCIFVSLEIIDYEKHLHEFHFEINIVLTVLNYIMKGCYLDTEHDRDLGVLKYEPGLMTIEYCAVFCKERVRNYTSVYHYFN